MKFTLTVMATFAALVSMVSAQDTDPVACTVCLQTKLGALPACVGKMPKVAGDPITPAYANCLCTSLSGEWIDLCNGADACGPTIELFKANYASNMKLAGLDCTGTPSWNPPA